MNENWETYHHIMRLENDKKEKELTEMTTKTNKQDPLEFLADGFLNYLSETVKGSQFQEEEFDALLDEQAGFSDDFKKKAKELFYEAVENQNPHVWPLRTGLAELLQIYAPFFEGNDVVHIALERIEELEDAIAYVKAENETLAAEQVSKLSESYSLDESIVTNLWNTSDSVDELHTKLQQTSRPEKPVRRSNVGEQLEELNESDFFTNGGGEYIDPKMRHYLKALGHK